jgi:hypothetical protein
MPKVCEWAEKGVQGRSEVSRCEELRCEESRCEELRCEESRCEELRCEESRCEELRCEDNPGPHDTHSRAEHLLPRPARLVYSLALGRALTP